MIHPRRLLPLLVALLALAGPTPGQGPDKKPKAEDKKIEKSEPRVARYALVVGARQYKKNELRPLKYADRDAKALAAVLEKKGYQVVLLTYESGAEDADLLPTARNVRHQLEVLAGECEPGGALLFAFFGHGAQFEGDKEVYLCPIDAEMGQKKTLLPLGEVYRELARCKADARLAIVDAGHASPEAQGPQRLVLRTRPQEVELPKGVRALFSCSPGQFSYESDRLEQGVFAHFLLRGLEGAAARGDRVTFSSLAHYLREEVPDAAKELNGPRARQLPILLGEGGEAVVRRAGPGN